MSETRKTTEILTEVSELVATVTISYPEKRNPIGTQTAEKLVAALRDLNGRDDVAVVVLTGAGSAFSAGGDLDEFLETVDAGSTELWERGGPWQDLYRVIPSMDKPVIAKVDGPAMAGGCGLVASCDFAYATERSVFGSPEIKIGLFTLFVLPGLLKCLSRRDAIDLVFSGRTIGAQDAQRMGLLNEVVADTEVLDEVVSRQAAMLSEIPAATMRRARSAFASIEAVDFEAGLEMARGLRPVFMGSEELRDGIEKFFKKRAN